MTITRRFMLAATAAASATPHAALTAPVRRLANPAASSQARALYAYLWSIYGKRTLTGQQELPWPHDKARRELDHIRAASGKLPALLGLDYILPQDWPGVAERATRWWAEESGIVTLCWHWGAPDIGIGYENSKKDFDVAAALQPGTPQNLAMRRDLAAVADQLTILRDRKVPVLWRPFHEFSGTWFWWGKHGPDAFKALWSLMWDYFTVDRKLNNLIWVLGYAGQNVDRAYLPPRGQFDIIGADIYVDDHGDLAGMFAQVKGLVGDSAPICLHENGPIPDPALLGRKADWLWFMTWHSGFILDGKTNPADLIGRYFQANRYLTKDELPDLVASK